MACSCQKKNQQFAVITNGGRQVFTSSSKDTAVSVSRRYAGSVVKDAKGDIVHPTAKTDTVKTDTSAPA